MSIIDGEETSGMAGTHEGDPHTYEEIDTDNAPKDPDGKPTGGGAHEGNET